LLNEPCWIEPKGVIRLILDEGEPHSIVNMDGLESACAKPKNLWAYEGVDDAPQLAASLLFGLARNHPFLQGNKRTAFTAMVGFLGGNGFKFFLNDDVSCADHLIAVLEGKASEESFLEILRKVTEPARPWG
jgi:death-on-curing protein